MCVFEYWCWVMTQELPILWHITSIQTFVSRHITSTCITSSAVGVLIGTHHWNRKDEQWSERCSILQQWSSRMLRPPYPGPCLPQWVIFEKSHIERGYFPCTLEGYTSHLNEDFSFLFCFSIKIFPLHQWTIIRAQKDPVKSETSFRYFVVAGCINK